MSVIAGTSVSVKTMADGTLRLTIDIEPTDAQAAFALFGAPGRSVALAALVDGHAAIKEPDPAAEKPKGGALAKLSGIWCGDGHFQAWLWIRFPKYGDISNATQAADVVRIVCGVDSRAELDSNKLAAAIFEERIRRPYMRHCVATGVTA